MSFSNKDFHVSHEGRKGSLCLFLIILASGFITMLSCTVIFDSGDIDALIANTFVDKGIKYETVSDSEVSVIGCDCSEVLVIPSFAIDGTKSYTVVSIGDSAFKGCKSLTSVTIPGSVHYIGNYAFEKCTSLTTLTISEGVESIGAMVFKDCISLTDVILPASVTSIGSRAFMDCTSLILIKMGHNVKNFTDFTKDMLDYCPSLRCFEFYGPIVNCVGFPPCGK